MELEIKAAKKEEITFESIGAKATEELAVMIDTFHPLHLTEHSLEFLDKNYPMSWTEGGESFNEVNAP